MNKTTSFQKVEVEYTDGRFGEVLVGDYRLPLTKSEEKEIESRLLKMEDRHPYEWDIEPLPPQHKIIKRVIKFINYGIK